MSDRDFSLRLPVPVIARPRRPLSISASTASCSIRFSLRTMISGAPSSRSRLSRLLRLITRRYRSLRSEVEPATVELDHRPQLWRNDRQVVEDHPGRGGAGLTECLDHLEPLDRLLALLARGRLRLLAE